MFAHLGQRLVLAYLAMALLNDLSHTQQVYTREQLFFIRNSTPQQALDKDLCNTVKHLKIEKPPHERDRNEIRHIPTRITSCDRIPTSRGSLCLQNLSCIPQRTDNLKFCLWNCQSARNKTTTIAEYLSDNDLDILALCETWYHPNGDDIIIGNTTPAGYKVLHKPRPSRGGGVAVFYKDTMDITECDIQQYTSFEALVCNYTYKSASFRIGLIYRPPPNAKNRYTTGGFLMEFTKFLESFVTVRGHLLLLGDFNFHVDNCKNGDARKFTETLDIFSLQQHVHQHTHKTSHTLDLVIAREADAGLLQTFWIDETPMSDHFPVHFEVSLPKPEMKKIQITYRKTKNIDIVSFQNDVRTSFARCEAEKVDELVQFYNSTLQELLDKHAPLKTKTVTLHPTTPWYTEEVRVAKREKRRAEKVWRKTKLCVHRDIYNEKRLHANRLVNKAKRDYYHGKVVEAHGDQKELFQIVMTLMNKRKQTIYPTCHSLQELSCAFNKFFLDKVNKIMSGLNTIREQNMDTVTVVSEQSFTGQDLLETFTPATEHEVQKIFMKSPAKSCCLDPLPSQLLKQAFEPLLPFLTQIVNASMSSGAVSHSLKVAAVTPLLKKTTLDHQQLKNYRPVSNLSCISKLCERVVVQRLNDHLEQHGLLEQYQSAYKKHHSIETALVRVHNDLLQTMDGKRCALLILLDLSAAFDTVQHDVLLMRLQKRIGISGKVLDWFTSYLSNRTQYVKLGEATSKTECIKYGVPQGSVLGPVLFTIYTSPLGDLVKSLGVSYHLYADDTQLYLTFDATDTDSQEQCLTTLENCISAVRVWMARNFLKLNDDKTEFLIIGNKPHLRKVTFDSIKIGDAVIGTSNMARNIGAIFDENMSLNKHVQAIMRSGYAHIRNIGLIRNFLDLDATLQIVHAFITSKLDCLNSLLYGLPDTAINKLQRIQAISGRIALRVGRLTPTKYVLKELHWLPVKSRIEYKILLLTYQCMAGTAPSYLRDLLEQKVVTRTLRSTSDTMQLAIPKTKTKYGDRTFAHAAPRLWNSVPLHIRNYPKVETFKKYLKTHLFHIAFD